MAPYGKKVYMKVVGRDQIYSFVVDEIVIDVKYVI